MGMAHTEGDGGLSRPDSRTPGYTRYRPGSETLPTMKRESSAYHSPDRFPTPQTQNKYTYPHSPDPSLQLPPLKNVEGYTQAQNLPHLQRVPTPNGEHQQQTGAYYAPLNQPPHYLSPRSGAVSAHSAHAQPVQQQSPPTLSPRDRSLSREKHRKEIKRRTKTGCLTCRKRRIKVSKCDDY